MIALGGIAEGIPIIPYSFSWEGGTRVDQIKTKLKRNRVMIRSLLTMQNFLTLANRKGDAFDIVRSNEMIDACSSPLVPIFRNVSRYTAGKLMIKIVREGI